ncbi:putative esterase [Gordonia soli NBRC 108243]|uniref:Putative esterase n=1 Tax=Gordonia soli NBRC 108243 TaxID=1223545 RepID=M0QEZ7_9ACTN|nr:putative esterase [Gordonia soli NBRC 108243]
MSLPLSIRAQRAFGRVAGRLPDSVLAAVGTRTRVNRDGDRLAPEMALVGRISQYVPYYDVSRGTLENSRRRIDLSAASFGPRFEPFAVEEDLVIPGPAGPIPATRYRAKVASRGLVLFFHGGGWTVGSRASHDSLVRTLAIRTGADVLSVDYRLAPAAPFPAAADDALAAWDFAVRTAPQWGLDPHRIVVAGDSAGGNLATVISQQVRDREVTPRLQVLIYPVVDLSTKRPSYHEFASGYYLDARSMDFYTDSYVPDHSLRTDPRASPMLADSLAGLAPTYIVVAGFDPLRDEGIEYARRLEEAGNDVVLDRAGTLIHGFANLTLISPGARVAVDRIGEAIADSLA